MSLRMRILVVAAGLAALVAGARAGPVAAGQSPAGGPAPSPEEAAAKKVERLVASTKERMEELQKAESDIEMNVMKAQYAAQQGLKDPTKAADQIAKNQMTPELKAYQASLLAAAREWKAFQGRYAGLSPSIKALDRERGAAPAALKDEIGTLITRFAEKNRDLQMKVADLLEKAGDYKGALAVCLAIYQDVPEAKRSGEGALKQRIAGLYEKSGDNASALAAIKSVVDARPEKDRYKDRKAGEQLGRLYEKTGDPKTALDVYKHTLDAIPANKRGKAAAGLEKKIADLEKKVAAQAPAQAK
jgi:tetratricopeptide (TPR) repeat protein